jgi:hypothetical protein
LEERYIVSQKIGKWKSLVSPGTPVSSTNKTNHHNITELLLKVALNTINLKLNLDFNICHWFCTRYMIIFSSVFQDRYPKLTYDRLFRKEYGFNNKLHRDDREHAKSRGLLVNDEVGINNKLILNCLPLYIYCHLVTGLSDCR